MRAAKDYIVFSLDVPSLKEAEQYVALLSEYVGMFKVGLELFISSGASETIKKYLGLTLIPQAGVAIGLTLLITEDSSYFEFQSVILNITLIAVAFNEIFGPVCTKFALFKAKEITVKE
jgi:hypothetical protein